MRKHLTLQRCEVIAVAVAAAFAGPASAIDINTESGWTGAFTTNVSVWANQRAEAQDKSLTDHRAAPNFGYPNTNTTPLVTSIAPGFSRLGGSKNPGEWNYNKGDLYSSGVKFLSELTLAKGDFSFLGRVKGWYDYTLDYQNVPYGNRAAWGPAVFPGPSATDGAFDARTGARWNKALSDNGAEALQKFSNIYLLDFVGTWKLDLGDNPASVRAGRHTINWGEGVFLRGIGQLAPLDVSSLRKAGADLKESLLPTWALSGSLGFKNFSLEGFYQLKWEPTSIEYCGTYWNPGHTSVGLSPGLCNVAENAALAATTTTNTALRMTDFGVINLPVLPGTKPKNAGAFGLALRFPVDAIDTEVSLYAQKISATTPAVSWTGIKGAGNVFSVTTSSAKFNYLDDIKILGVSATTNLGGINWAGELSYQKGIPVGYNGDDANALLGATNAMREQVAARLAGLPNGTQYTYDWYERRNKWQLILNGLAVLPSGITSALGASNGSVVGEVGFEWNDIPDNKQAGAVRFGRSIGVAPFTNSAGVLTNDTSATGAGVNCITGAGQLTEQDAIWCSQNGFVTRSSWGYRLRGSLSYPQVFGSNWMFKPSLFFAQDVKGVSMDGQFQEGRKTIALGLNFDLNNRHSMDFGYTTYAGKYYLDRDKDNYSFVYSFKF